MTRKGIVSVYDSSNKTARVMIPELNNSLSAELTVANYVGELRVNDLVVVDFYEDLSSGVIILNLDNNEGTTGIINIDGGSFV